MAQASSKQVISYQPKQYENDERVSVSAVRLAGNTRVQKEEVSEVAPETRVKRATGKRQILPL